MACVGNNASVLELGAAAEAYFRILDASLASLSDPITASVHTNSMIDRSDEEIRQRLYHILCVIAETFRDHKKHVILGKLATDLKELGLVVDEPQTTAQLVFILFGAFTMMYVPNPDPEPGKLQMRASNIGASIQRRSTATWVVGSQELNLDASFDDLLFRYCRHEHGPIPRPHTRDHDPVGGPPDQSRLLPSEDVSFYTLDRLLKVQISWTKSICEHLEFNVKTKSLKLFRVPSYCVLLCLLEPEKTFLDRYVDLQPIESHITF